MNETIELIASGLLVGVGATALLDVWIAFLKRAFGVPSRSWALVGRWVGHFPRGRFVHESIASAAPVRHELALGWIFHYLVGAVYGLLVAALWGSEWLQRPSLFPALLVALLTLTAPFFVMDPAMGNGIAASRSANPGVTRLRAVMNHAVFGVGLYASAWLGAAAA